MTAREIKRVSIKGCGVFIEYFTSKIMSQGLAVPLRDFGAETHNAMGRAIGSWYKGLCRGESLQSAIRKMSPRFPSCVEELLLLACERSILDRVLKDVLVIFHKKSSEQVVIGRLRMLKRIYQNKPKGGIICSACFADELLKIISRARLEKASEVILEQENEEFFHLSYPPFLSP